MPTFARRPSTISSFFLVDIDSRCRNCNSTSFLHVLHFMLEDKNQKPSDYLFWFSIGSNVMDQKSGDGRFIEQI